MCEEYTLTRFWYGAVLVGIVGKCVRIQNQRVCGLDDQIALGTIEINRNNNGEKLPEYEQ